MFETDACRKSDDSGLETTPPSAKQEKIEEPKSLEVIQNPAETLVIDVPQDPLLPSSPIQQVQDNPPHAEKTEDLKKMSAMVGVEATPDVLALKSKNPIPEESNILTKMLAEIQTMHELCKGM